MTRLTPDANITSSIALSNLLSGPTGGAPQPQPVALPSAIAATAPAHTNANLRTASPKRRYSEVTSDGSDSYYDVNGRRRKSPRPEIQHGTSVRPGAEQADSAIQPGSAEARKASQQQHTQTNSGQTSQRHAQARMRSSIACVRCRRSKVKCVNSGVGTPCRSCEAGGRECSYPVPVNGGRRRESMLGQVARPEVVMDDQVGTQVLLAGAI